MRNTSWEVQDCSDKPGSLRTWSKSVTLIDDVPVNEFVGMIIDSGINKNGPQNISNKNKGLRTALSHHILFNEGNETLRCTSGEINIAEQIIITKSLSGKKYDPKRDLWIDINSTHGVAGSREWSPPLAADQLSTGGIHVTIRWNCPNKEKPTISIRANTKSPYKEEALNTRQGRPQHVPYGYFPFVKQQ